MKNNYEIDCKPKKKSFVFLIKIKKKLIIFNNEKVIKKESLPD